jgi:hypothetical protein
MPTSLLSPVPRISCQVHDRMTEVHHAVNGASLEAVNSPDSDEHEQGRAAYGLI